MDELRAQQVPYLLDRVNAQKVSRCSRCDRTPPDLAAQAKASKPRTQALNEPTPMPVGCVILTLCADTARPDIQPMRRPLIRPATAADAAAIADIYNPFIRDTVITFEEVPIQAEQLAQRIEAVGAQGLPWLVSEAEGQVLGYAYADQWRSRSAYRYSVESAIYLDRKIAGQGIGTLLYQHLIEQLQRDGIHAVIAGITLPNAASVALHERLGFHKVAHFPSVGLKFGQWLDVGYWQRTLEAPD